MASLALAVCLLFALVGCKTLEERCLERFPTTDSTEVRTRTITDTLILPDTYVEFLDTTVCPPDLKDTLVITKTITRRLPGQVIYNDYECIDTLVVFRDATKVSYLVKELATANGRADEFKATAKNRLWMIIGLGSLVALLGFFTARGLIKNFA